MAPVAPPMLNQLPVVLNCHWYCAPPPETPLGFPVFEIANGSYAPQFDSLPEMLPGLVKLEVTSLTTSPVNIKLEHPLRLAPRR